MKSPGTAAHAEHALVEPDVELFLRRHAAVVLDRVLARRLVALDGKRIAADLDQFGRREELHPRRIADDRVDERALVDDERLEPLALRFDGAGQADRARPDDHDVLQLGLRRVNGFSLATNRARFRASLRLA